MNAATTDEDEFDVLSDDDVIAPLFSLPAKLDGDAGISSDDDLSVPDTIRYNKLACLICPKIFH